MTKTIRKAFQSRLNIREELNQKLSSYAGGCRFVWNEVNTYLQPLTQ